MFHIKNVSKKYHGEFALNSVSMDIGKGLNFIVGASGSGKTTLLKIISGMEQDFDGAVSYCSKSIKTLTSKEKSCFYNNIFGFVWQDFNLLEDSTVLENVLLPSYLKNENSRKRAEKVLKDLTIFDIALQKVKYLSGGQKQRVAIARELMKNPQVIIADEPTSALDEKTSKTIMDILRTLSNNRTVIIVTHETSFITDKDNVFELDKGEIITKLEVNLSKKSEAKTQISHRLSLKSALSISKSSIKNKPSRFAISALTLLIASVLLLTTLSGAISGSSQGEFDKLVETYGESLMDISVIDSFVDASGTEGNGNKKPDGTVSQSIEGLYDHYVKDDRLSFITYMQAFDDIKITVDSKEYSIQSSGNAPVINKIVSGKMPIGNTNEVVVPQSFINKLDVSSEKAIGKELEFNGAIYDWSTGQPVLKPVSCKAKIVGVIDTTSTYEYEGTVNSFTVDDSFFFSKPAISDMISQSGSDMNNADFLIRAKTPADMIAIKDELNKKGIVPLGRFELVEDMVRLNTQTSEQSGFASFVIVILSLFMVVTIYLVTGFMRKREYAIYKVSGFDAAHLCKIALLETLFASVSAVALLFICSPLINFATCSLFAVNILTIKMLLTGALLIITTSLLAYATSVITFAKVNISTALKTGDR